MTKVYEYKDSMLGLIHKKRRRLFAYLRQNQIKRIKAILLILVVVFSNCSIFAVENNNINYGKYKINVAKDPFMYVIFNGVMQPNYMYSYSDEEERCVYCLERGKVGPESKDEYFVDAKEKITDEMLQLILLNCYPYKSPEELGLMSVEQAKFASQFAIWCYTSGVYIDSIEPISDLNLDMIQAIKKIYYSKDGNLDDYKVDLNIKENKMQIENGYITKTIELDTKNILEYNITSSDSNITIKKEENRYKICLPLDKIENKYSTSLKIEYKAKENISLLGKKEDVNNQDMAVLLDTTFNGQENYILNFAVTTTDFTLQKIDKDTKEPLSGVKYSITDNNNIDYGTKVTDENGKLTLKIKYVDGVNIIVKEVKSKEGYVCDTNPHIYQLKGCPICNEILENEKEKGIIQIIKKTKEYNKVTDIKENTPLQNVEFEILDNNMNIVQKVTTDEYGYCKTERIPIGKYYIKETKTNPNYELLKELVEVEIKENDDQMLVQILNDNATILNELTVTGK